MGAHTRSKLDRMRAGGDCRAADQRVSPIFAG